MAEDIQFPQTDEAKIVQLYIDQNRVILRAGSNKRDHSQILKSALEEFGLVSYPTVKIFGEQVPALAGDNYRVVGMGWCTRVGECFSFYGDSMSYEIGLDLEHLERCREALPSGMELEVDKE